MLSATLKPNTRKCAQCRTPLILPDREYLWEVFDYDDGVLTWKQSRPRRHFKNDHAAFVWHTKYPGKRAGRVSAGYRQIMVDRVRYLEHRLIAQMFGIDLSNEIDHIDGNRLNNRVENLRAATKQQNARNNPGWSKKKSRVGIGQRANGRWIAHISVNGRMVRLGTFLTESEAAAARAAAERQYYEGFARNAEAAP